MNRKDFLKSGLILGGATIIPNTSAFAQNLTANTIDKLVDRDGNFIHQTLPYADINFALCEKAFRAIHGRRNVAFTLHLPSRRSGKKCEQRPVDDIECFGREQP